MASTSAGASPAPALVDRMRNEFREMPGLRLTVAQAARFWGRDAATCQAALDALVREGLLRVGRGAYSRAE